MKKQEITAKKKRESDINKRREYRMHNIKVQERDGEQGGKQKY